MDNISIPGYLQPGFGQETCFVKGNSLLEHTCEVVAIDYIFNFMYAESSPKSKLIYIFIPLCIIFTANLTFFIVTAYKIIQLKRCVSKITRKQESRRHQKKLNKKTDKWVHFWNIELKIMIIY